MKFRTTLVNVVLLIAAGCGGSSSSGSSANGAEVNNSPPPVSAEITRYNGPGSRWDVALDRAGTFTIERRDTMTAPVTLTVNGEYTELDNGFMSLVVSDAEGDNAPEPGAEAWGIEVPGFAYFLKPAHDNSEFIAMVMAGACPQTDFTGNWIIMKSRDNADATESDQEFFGVFAYDFETGEASLPAQHALTDGFPGQVNTALDQGDCADGLMQVDDAEMYLSESGGALVHTNVDSDTESSIIFAMPQESLLAIGDLDAEYAGLLFSSGDDTIEPAVLVCTAGICSGDILDDVESGTATANFQLNFTGTLDFPDVGLITGTVEVDGIQGNLACMANVALAEGSPMLLTCVGQDPNQPSARMNLIVRSR